MRQSTSALAMLSLSDDPEAQLAAAKRFVENKLPQITELPGIQPYNHNKIRIGYLSSDLCLHPVAMLTAELFELHDKSQLKLMHIAGLVKMDLNSEIALSRP